MTKQTWAELKKMVDAIVSDDSEVTALSTFGNKMEDIHVHIWIPTSTAVATFKSRQAAEIEATDPQ